MTRFNKTSEKMFKTIGMLLLIFTAVTGCTIFFNQEAKAARVVVRSGGILPARVIIRPARVIIRPGRTVTVLPTGYTVVRINGLRFFYHAGVFYARRGDGYIVAPAPVGALVRVLPAGYTTQVYGGVTYFSYNGIFYLKSPSGFRVVAPPVQQSSVQTISVNINALNVRTGPGLNYPQQGMVYRNTILEVKGSAPGWLYVRLPAGNKGWISDQYVTFNPSPPT